MDTLSQHNNTIENLVNFYAELIISQFSTENNKNFIKKILTFILQNNPYILKEYYNYSIAEGEHLTKLAYTLAGLERFADGINLTDAELQLLIAFKILKDRIKCNSLFELADLLFSFFGDNVQVFSDYHAIVYYIDISLVNSNLMKPIIKYKLLPIPVDAYSVSLIKFDKTKKYVFFPPYDNISYGSNQASISNYNDAIQNSWLSVDDFIAYG